MFFIYLPTITDVVGYYKFRNEVMVWFMQMICYSVQYLHPIAFDVEENPGPTIFDIFDPTSADSIFFS